jgi:phospholipid-binding lipoprotein MlaA
MTLYTPRQLVLLLFLLIVLAAPACHAGNQSGTVKPFIPSQTGAPATTTPPPAAPTPTAPTSPDAAAAPAAANDTESLAETTPPAAPVPDPLYAWNKFWFTFNDLFYSGLMRPLSKGYTFVVPKMARTGISNAYHNFTFPIRFISALLQLDFTKASREFGRFMLNSTFGVGGLVDVAAMGDPNLQPGNEDFGQALGHYGMPEGFYIVWPLLGPSNLRDSFGLIGDAAANPLTWIFGPWNYYGDYNPWYWSYIIKAGYEFNRLPETLEAYDSIVKPAIEPYSAVKDAYIQYRRNAVAH